MLSYTKEKNYRKPMVGKQGRAVEVLAGEGSRVVHSITGRLPALPTWCGI